MIVLSGPWQAGTGIPQGCALPKGEGCAAHVAQLWLGRVGAGTGAAAAAAAGAAWRREVRAPGMNTAQGELVSNLALEARHHLQQHSNSSLTHLPSPSVAAPVACEAGTVPWWPRLREKLVPRCRLSPARRGE